METGKIIIKDGVKILAKPQPDLEMTREQIEAKLDEKKSELINYDLYLQDAQKARVVIAKAVDDITAELAMFDK